MNSGKGIVAKDQRDYNWKSVEYIELINQQYDWIRSNSKFIAPNAKNSIETLIREEFLELQNDGTLKLKFFENPLDVFWIAIKNEIREQSFSRVVLIRNVNLDQDLRVAVSNIEPNTKLLCSLKQIQDVIPDNS